MKSTILIALLLLGAVQAVSAAQAISPEAPIDWASVHFDTLGHHGPWFERSVEFLSSQPDSVFLNHQANGDYLACIVTMLAMAAKHSNDLKEAWSVLPGDHPALQHQKAFLTHSGRDWAFWSEVAVVGYAISIDLPVVNERGRSQLGMTSLSDIADGEFLRVVKEMEAAFTPILDGR